MCIFKKGQSSSLPTTIALTVTTSCQHLQSEATQPHCSSLPVASVTTLVHRANPCLRGISQCCCGAAVTASLIVWVFSAAPEERAVRHPKHDGFVLSLLVKTSLRAQRTATSLPGPTDSVDSYCLFKSATAQHREYTCLQHDLKKNFWSDLLALLRRKCCDPNKVLCTGCYNMGSCCAFTNPKWV